MRQCQELKVYNYNTNTTADILNCTCSGCCYTFLLFIYFLFFCVFLMSSILICEISNYKKEQHRQQEQEQQQQLPAYTENV